MSDGLGAALLATYVEVTPGCVLTSLGPVEDQQEVDAWPNVRHSKRGFRQRLLPGSVQDNDGWNVRPMRAGSATRDISVVRSARIEDDLVRGPALQRDPFSRICQLREHAGEAWPMRGGASGKDQR